MSCNNDNSCEGIKTGCLNECCGGCCGCLEMQMLHAFDVQKQDNERLERENKELSMCIKGIDAQLAIAMEHMECRGDEDCDHCQISIFLAENMETIEKVTSNTREILASLDKGEK
jgi:hypothetical protein